MTNPADEQKSQLPRADIEASKAECQGVWCRDLEIVAREALENCLIKDDVHAELQESVAAV